MKEKIYVPTQGITSFKVKDELQELKFIWKNEYDGFIFFIAEHSDEDLDIVEQFLFLRDLDYYYADNNIDKQLVLGNERYKKKRKTFIKSEITKLEKK